MEMRRPVEPAIRALEQLVVLTNALRLRRLLLTLDEGVRAGTSVIAPADRLAPAEQEAHA